MNLHARALSALAHLAHLAEEHINLPGADPEGPNVYWQTAENFSLEFFGSAVLVARIPKEGEEPDTLDGPPMVRCPTMRYSGDPNGTVFVQVEET
jgi:hypothetical protein